MQKFTEYGQSVITDLATRYGISNDAVIHMLYAVSNGGGTMAQFNCPELGGGGQWMQGGMTMVGDMFNYGLKSTVDNLCSELSNILANQQSNLFVPVRKPQPQPQNRGGQQQQQGGSGQQQGGQHQQQGNMGQNSLFISGSGFGNNWWGDDEDLGVASSTGGQNNIRYAVFPQTHRLAVEINGRVTVYDTLDHQIGGVSQQQGYDASLTFTSQYGLIQVSQLPIVSIDGVKQNKDSGQASSQQMGQQAFQQPIEPVQNTQPLPNPASSNELEDNIFTTIERLAGLRDKGFLSEEEYSQKKAELLQRL